MKKTKIEDTWASFCETNVISDSDLVHLISFYEGFRDTIWQAGGCFVLAISEVNQRIATLNSIKFFRENKF